jgi:putative FmdB family regulatory protein
MPLYEYDCKDCSKQVEILVSSVNAKPSCPQCGSKKLTKLLSVIGSPVMGGGADSARKSSVESGLCGRSQCASGGCMNGN